MNTLIIIILSLPLMGISVIVYVELACKFDCYRGQHSYLTQFKGGPACRHCGKLRSD